MKFKYRANYFLATGNENIEFNDKGEFETENDITIKILQDLGAIEIDEIDYKEKFTEVNLIIDELKSKITELETIKVNIETENIELKSKITELETIKVTADVKKPVEVIKK